MLQTASVHGFANSAKSFINAELFSAFFGPVRFGLSASFKTTGDTSRENAIRTNVQKIISNGGAFSVNGLFPMLFLRNKSDAYHMGLFAHQNFGLLPTSIDSNGKNIYSGESTCLTGQSGFLLHMDAGSANDNGITVRLYSDLSYYYVYGNYNQALNLPDFSIVSLKVGCVIGDLINFNAWGPLACSQQSIQNTPFNISLQFSPSQVALATHGNAKVRRAVPRPAKQIDEE
jgi:hypothetical protein